MKKQSLMVLVATTLMFTGCGKKNETSPIPPAKINTTEPGSPASASSNGDTKLNLSKFNISNTRVGAIHDGLSQVTGVISGEINAIVPCSLKYPVDLYKKAGAVSLNQVVIGDRKVSLGSINLFDIKRNGKNQNVRGLELLDDKGQALLSLKRDYSDLKNDKDCTQMMVESYEVRGANNEKTIQRLERVSVLEGQSVITTTTLLNGSKIIRLQIEKKENNNVEQYCVQEAKLVTTK